MKVELDIDAILYGATYRIYKRPKEDSFHLVINGVVEAQGATIEEAFENLFEFAIEKLMKENDSHQWLP